MQSATQEDISASSKPRLVEETAAQLRELILGSEPDTQIGSLKELAERLGVGIVTVQQAARILEHEGLLAVRRGPGGGYYGRRPDEAALERSLDAYLRVHGFGYREALEMISLLDCEIAPAAAGCSDETLREDLRALYRRIELCATREQRRRFEEDLRELLFAMVSRPLMQFVLRITSRQYRTNPGPPVFVGEEDVAAWKLGRRRMLQAILDGDEELARFEAERYRQQVLKRLRRGDGKGGGVRR